MTVLASITLAILVLVLAFQTVRDRKPPRSPVGIERLMRETVIITLKSGETWQGVLWEDDGRSLVLRSAFGIGMAERSENLPVDGELILFVADIAYAQRP